MKLCAAFLLVVTSFSGSAWALQASQPGNGGRADLIPFSTETYNPVKKSDFVDGSKQTCTVTKPGSLADLLRRSHETGKTFDDLRVRGFLLESGEPIFVDAKGIFEYESKRYVVSEKDFREVKKEHFACSDDAQYK